MWLLTTSKYYGILPLETSTTMTMIKYYVIWWFAIPLVTHVPALLLSEVDANDKDKGLQWDVTKRYKEGRIVKMQYPHRPDSGLGPFDSIGDAAKEMERQDIKKAYMP